MPHPRKALEHSASDLSCPQDRQPPARRHACAQHSIPHSDRMEYSIPAPTRKCPQKTSTFLGWTFGRLAQPRGMCHVDGHLVVDLQVASGWSSAGEYPMAIPRSPQSAHLIAPYEFQNNGGGGSNLKGLDNICICAFSVVVLSPQLAERHFQP